MITKTKGKARRSSTASQRPLAASPSINGTGRHKSTASHTSDAPVPRTKRASARQTPRELHSNSAATLPNTSATDLNQRAILGSDVGADLNNAGPAHSSPENHPDCGGPAPKKARRRPTTHVTHNAQATPAPNKAESDQEVYEAPSGTVAPALTHIRLLVKQRNYLIDQRRRTTLSAKAYARSVLGWKRDAGDMSEIKKAASDLVDRAFAGKTIDAPAALLSMLEVFARSLDPIASELKRIEKTLKESVRALPIWKWAEAERGIGEVLLSSLIGELGDPGAYANPAKVWKRMGLSVTNAGEESTHSPIGSAMKNPLVGYCPRRRSVAFLIGDAFIKARSPRRSVYDARKTYTEANRPDWTKLRRHRDAHRVMVKKWLIEFLKEWRGTRKTRANVAAGVYFRGERTGA